MRQRQITARDFTLIEPVSMATYSFGWLKVGDYGYGHSIFVATDRDQGRERHIRWDYALRDPGGHEAGHLSSPLDAERRRSHQSFVVPTAGRRGWKSARLEFK
jgi:hypothetical protein